MNNLGLIKMFLSISIIILVWIIVQFAMFKIEVPESLEKVFSFFINFNLIFLILLPIFLIISFYLLIKKNKIGLYLVVINLTSTLLFFSGDFIVSWLK
ncbi:hypothetical protein [Chryseobacterium taihuense]|uniref:Uncharacterized protein n=1 Tax=Chryseobacterium taihuense TaxID=1141221 RepID=A0ABY0R0C5_9FLAO|nr:hypothetical protein [Chryseobacterium taihuense]SDM21464.1 hypothetical protein SAMN05216273_11752 [Chryseobacterium taihuense]